MGSLGVFKGGLESNMCESVLRNSVKICNAQVTENNRFEAGTIFMSTFQSL